jgi:hypothetical protein
MIQGLATLESRRCDGSDQVDSVARPTLSKSETWQGRRKGKDQDV